MTTAAQRAGTHLTSQFIQPLQFQLIARKLVAKNPDISGQGVKSAEMRKVVNMGGGTISFKYPRRGENKDNIRVDVESVDIPILYQEFEVPRGDFDAFQREGKRMDSAAATSAAYVVGRKEDDFFINGWKPDGSNLEINGLYSGAGNDYATSADFGTNGKAKQAVVGALALISADSALAPAYNLLLNPVQYGELLASENANGVEEMPQVLKLINRGNANGPGEIISFDGITAGTGLMSPVDPGRVFMEFIEPVPIRTQMGIDPVFPETSDVEGMVYEFVYPYIKYANGLCKLSAI